MGKTKKIFTSLRVIVVLIAVLLAIVAIHPNPWVTGVAIRSIELNSSASLAGIESPKPTSSPMSKERITSINNIPIKNVLDYENFVSSLTVNRTITVKTNKQSYLLKTKPAYKTIILNETEEQIIPEIIQINETINGTTTLINKTINKTILVNKTLKEFIGMEDLGLKVYNAPTTNIKKGLDLQGGTRVLLQPEETIPKDMMGLTIENMKERLNVYGITDVIVREAGDLSGNQYILAEIAGMTEDEVRGLLSKQGKFEAKIGESIVFNGGEKDITYVCRSADCSGIDPGKGCGRVNDGTWACSFRFSIALKPEAAQRQADLTRDLEIISSESGEEYLSQDLKLLLDDKEVDTLKIGADLKGRPVTDIQISGSGAGNTQQEAVFNALENMKKMQTVLVTGSLPVQLNIAKIDIISPALGSEFIQEAGLIAILAIIAIFLIIFIKYRTLKVTIPMALTLIIEVILILGIAALIGWDLDLAAIAGIIIAVGTGIDHQIIIADESLKGLTAKIYDWKTKIKRAFFIIIVAYTTTVVAMIPLMFAGAGLLKGFALTTIIGVSIGVFISRPAYAKTLEILLKD
ncbi:hypothetical protein H8D83_00885 [Candidatus Woesearchaeota archaeon]|nr:hypothetical protein [Candidatus Woesearchaeota archaeon]MBL7051345.1 hypothetical protein [Candidatus Woesearchaeota archaeon]